MMFLKITSVLFLIFTIILSIITARLLRLKRFGLNFADIAFPLLVCEFYLISDHAFYHSLLPHILLALSLLAIGITVYFLKVKKKFYYPKFIKFFWRAGFLLTFVLYLSLMIFILIFK
ncbi:Integral membrane protein [Streptococcus sp. DD10]|uniref:DUF3397 domain-containing protein n=1 Tax=Streptococcus sp. DD10 TaxID=1777878 RepID=UPI000799999E|nr:DUF3397 domain-containing protein [Streptococcus sp. DD10]KXT75150.1 Integral membrane protein [Streptococcus sp. DD10]